MMSTPARTPGLLQEAYKATELLLSEKYRKYLFLPGRLLPAVMERFRDDLAEALDLPMPEVPRRKGRIGPARLDDLTTSELDGISRAVKFLVTRATPFMDDPGLPAMLRDLLSLLNANAAERAAIAEADTAKAKAS
jgi:hypothetical protein